MTADLTLKEGDTEPILTATLQRDGSAFDLSTISNVSVQFVMGATDEAPQVDATAAIVTAADGTVQYEWAASDTGTPGTYACEFVVTGDNFESTFPGDGYFYVTVESEVQRS